jgi:hypothetical protein
MGLEMLACTVPKVVSVMSITCFGICYGNNRMIVFDDCDY